MKLRMVAVICILAAAAPSAVLGQKNRVKGLETRLDALERRVEQLTQQLTLLNRKLAAGAPQKAETPAGNTMATIYKSLRITDARVVSESASPGDVVTVAYKLTNTTDQDLQIPVNQSYSRPFRLVGTLQHWIERKGGDGTISGISPRTARKGSRYAAGGSIVPTPSSLGAGKSLPFQKRISTTGFPRGRYTYYVVYQELEGAELQTVEVNFELN